MSWIQKVSDFIHGGAVKVSQMFIWLFGHDAAVAFGHDALVLLKSDLGKIVVAVVSEVAAMQVGADSKTVAFSKIKAASTAAGIDAKDSIINLLIELAVGALKGHFIPA